MQNQSGPGDQITVRGMTNVAGFGAVCYATCLTPFLRANFGCEALGFQGLFAALALLLLAGADRVGLAYFLIWLVALAIRRWETTWRWLRGQKLHSQYAGDSLLALGCSNEFAKRFLEPPLALLCGWCLGHFSPIVGAFVMGGAGALVAVQCIDAYVVKMRLQQMQDAEIEGHYYASRFRGR